MELNKQVQKSILVFADWFEPGFKAGGPIRSTLNVARQLKDNYEVYVITTDRDLNSTSPYPGIQVDQWSAFEEKISIYYASPAALTWKNILRQIIYIQPGYIYLNSMYSRFFTVYPLMMKRLGLIETKVILAPRGMLRPTAVQFKSGKKKLFFSVMKLLGIPKHVEFQATDQTEYNDVQRQFGKSVIVKLVPNLGVVPRECPEAIKKTPGMLKAIFIGRLHPIKNLDYLLESLPNVSGDVELTVVGNEEDVTYASYCKTMASRLPQNINVKFVGELPNNKLLDLLRHNHIFILPTQGENFGHAILEAMAQGKPVLISDQTPWRKLADSNAGWDIDLHDKEKFTLALQQAIDANHENYREWSRGAWALAHDFSSRPGIKDSYLKLFT